MAIKLRASWSTIPKRRNMKRVYYRGQLLDADHRQWWACVHKHAGREAAEACAAKEHIRIGAVPIPYGEWN